MTRFGGAVIQGFFVGGQMRTSIAATAARREAPVAASRQAPGPPSPAFAARQALAQQRPAPGRPTLVNHLSGAPRGNGSIAIDPAYVGLVSSGGKPLPGALLAKMEAVFGADFSAVRVHVGPQAARIGAVAFTTGNDLYFAPGQYQPQSSRGQHLIGHELAHVIQQREGRVRGLGSGVVVVQDRTLEADADRWGIRAAMHSNSASIQRKAAGAGRTIVGPPSRVGPPTVVPRQGRSIQRMDDDYVDSDQSYSDDSGMEDEVLIAHSGFLPQWQAGVNTGYRDGWDQAIVDEAAQANPVITPFAAQAMVGGPLVGPILALQAPPPNDFIIPEAGEATNHGWEYGYGPGYQDGAAAAFRICGWLRGNYPAIPAMSRLAALAQNGGTCVYCNAAPSTQADHVYPVQKHWVTIGCTGAALATVNDPSNLVGSCGPCNLAKSNTYLNAWNPPGWGVGAWFPFGPPAGTIPARRGGPLLPATW